MAVYYVDTSVMVKRYINEQGSAAARQLFAPSHVCVTSVMTLTEVWSAFNRLRREHRIDANGYADLVQASIAHWKSFMIVDIDDALIEQTRPLFERHPLRAADALQLASALYANRPLVAAGLPPLTFLAADERLLLAAHAEGLPIHNPLGG